VLNLYHKHEDSFPGPRNKGDFTVAGYGAVGNGTSNDQPAISSALQAAVDWCSNLGPATLYFHGSSTNTNYLAGAIGSTFFSITSVSNLTLASDSATTPAMLRSAINVPFAVFEFTGPTANITVSNLILTNFHGWTAADTIGYITSSGLYFNGTNFGMQHGITVTGCTFAGFGEGVTLDGASNGTVSNCTFLFPMGRNSGTWTNTWPNVGIALGMYSNTGVWCQNFTICSNDFNGLSAGNSAPAMGAGDGLLNAIGDGIKCYGNHITNQGVEAIILQAHEEISQTNASIVASNCYIYSNVIWNPIGPTSGWGIRCDVSGSGAASNLITRIYGNTISNTIDALAVTPQFGLIASNVAVFGNTIYAASTTNAYAAGLDTLNVTASSFYRNTVTLILTNATVWSQASNYLPYPYQVGIRAVSPVNCSNIYFYTNNFNFISTGNITNTNYGIFVSGVFLDPNFDNFTNNTFTNTVGVFATGYPIGTNYPNDLSAATLTNYIAQSNYFH
jgi:hypothetical protein